MDFQTDQPFCTDAPLTVVSTDLDLKCLHICVRVIIVVFVALSVNADIKK